MKISEIIKNLKWSVWAMPLLGHMVTGLSKWSVWAMPLLEHMVTGLSKWSVWVMPFLGHMVTGLSKWSVWAMPLLGHMVTGLSKCSLPLQDQVGFVVYWHCDRFVSSTLVLPSQCHFTNALHPFIHLLLQPQKLTM